MKLQTVPGKASATASPTIDPNAQAAITAYKAFRDAVDEALRHPVAEGGTYRSKADFTKHSVDPIRKLYAKYIAGLAKSGSTFKGDPPQAQPRAVRVDMGAAAGPTVTLDDCQTVGDRHEFQNGKKVKPIKRTVPQPYSLTVTMIYVKSHWAAKVIDVDTSRTCTR